MTLLVLERFYWELAVLLPTIMKNEYFNMRNCNGRLEFVIYLDLLAASVEEYLDAIMWHPFRMFYTIVDHSLESICLDAMLKLSFLSFFAFLFETPVCIWRELHACLNFCSTENFNLVAVVVYHMITLLFSDENDGT
jgi:hypothetical protein